MFRRPGRGWPSATGRRGSRPRRWRPSAAGRSACRGDRAGAEHAGGWTCAGGCGRGCLWAAGCAGGESRHLAGGGCADRPDARGAVAADAGGQSGLGLWLVQAAVAQMDRQTPMRPARPAGHIVLISSTAGQRGEANHADYAVTKGALISLTKSLSSELAPKGIRVNCVAPGWVATEMSAAAVGDAEMGAKIRAGIPVGRVASAAGDCRAGVVFVYAAGRVHLRRSAERERRRGSGGIEEAQEERMKITQSFAGGGGGADAGLAARYHGRRRRRRRGKERAAGARGAGRHGAGAGRPGLART